MAAKSPITTSQGLTLCLCYLVTRKDGVTTHAFTDNNEDVTVLGVTYKPLGAVSGSAAQTKVGFDPGNMDFTGIIDGTTITFDDLVRDQFTDGTLDIRLVDWSEATPTVHRHDRYVITHTEWDNHAWKASIEDLKHKLSRKVGRVITRNCPHVLGDAKCGVDLPNHAHTQSLTVDTVTDQSTFTLTNIGTIFTGNVTPADAYPLGKIQFTSGSNNGDVIEIVSVAGSSPWTITLRVPAYYTIQSGDTLTISPGCDKTTTTCKAADRYNNYTNFGGFPHVPSTDEAYGPGHEA